jgi:hypothetical protein
MYSVIGLDKTGENIFGASYAAIAAETNLVILRQAFYSLLKSSRCKAV